MTENDILVALKEAYRRAGTQTALAEKAGISQGRIADYLNKRYDIGNMTVSTLLKLFPDIVIDFFGGKTANSQSDLMREQVLKIFDSLSDADKVRFVAMAAANFGEKIREETKK